MDNSNVLVLEPEGDQIIFDRKGRAELPVSTSLVLRNSSQSLDVLFRIQTTSPGVYRVRPPHGRLASGTSATIQIVMANETTKADKFLVKWVTVPHGLRPGDFRSQFEEAAGSAKDRRLRVTFINAGDGDGDGDGAGAEALIGSPLRTTPASAESPSPAGSEIKRADSTQVSESSPMKRSDSLLYSDQPPPPPPQGSSSSTASLHSTVPSVAVLENELKEAKAKIQMLVAKNQELTKGAAKKRNVLGSATDGQEEDGEDDKHPSTKLTRGISDVELDRLISAQAGFPPVLVILIAIFAFLIGLLF